MQFIDQSGEFRQFDRIPQGLYTQWTDLRGYTLTPSQMKRHVGKSGRVLQWFALTAAEQSEWANVAQALYWPQLLPTKAVPTGRQAYNFMRSIGLWLGNPTSPTPPDPPFVPGEGYVYDAWICAGPDIYDYGNCWLMISPTPSDALIYVELYTPAHTVTPRGSARWWCIGIAAADYEPGTWQGGQMGPLLHGPPDAYTLRYPPMVEAGTVVTIRCIPITATGWPGTVQTFSLFVNSFGPPPAL